ncbi:MAG: hypothetical protein AB7F79_04565 [Steroidobacteraceae bacterium]
MNAATGLRCHAKNIGVGSGVVRVVLPAFFSALVSRACLLRSPHNQAEKSDQTANQCLGSELTTPTLKGVVAWAEPDDEPDLEVNQDCALIIRIDGDARGFLQREVIV